MKTPRVGIVHNVIKESDWVLPHPSAHIPHDTSAGIRGWPIQYPDVDPLGMVGYRPTQRHMKLLSLQDSINPICAST
jgi:hypothetical protein